MALERTLNGDLNPNPQEFTSEYRKECDDDPRRAANIQKFKEVVIKLAGSAPNKPLSETQKSTVGERLNELLSDHRTPDHPPYSLMIERAIRELNKDGWGSSEESVSNFIRKEYDHLPWSHFTLLKHHLGALCDGGSIILTNSQHYLLAGTDATLTFDKNCKRRKSRKEQDSEREIKLQQRDIGRESVLQKGLEQQQCLEAQAKKDLPAKEDAKQIDEGDDLERPPGFETVAFEETSNFLVSCTENPSQECGISIINHELLAVKSVAASRSKQGPTKFRIRIPAVKPSSLEEPHPPQEIIDKPDSSIYPTASSLLHLQSQEQAISDTSKQQKVKSLTNNGSEHKVHSVQASLPSCTEEHHPSVCSKLDKQYQAHKFPELGGSNIEELVTELGASNIEELSPTSRTQRRHRNRWYKKLNLKQSQPHQHHQEPSKSSQLTMKQAILGMRVKKNERQQKVTLPSSSDQQEFNKFSSLQMHPKHSPEKRVSQKLSNRLLRPWLLKSPSHSHLQQQQQQQQQQKGKPESGIITNDEVMSLPNHHPAGEQQQQQQQKGKPESGIITNDEVMSLPNHHPAGEQQHTPRHGRSRKEQEGKSRCLPWQ